MAENTILYFALGWALFGVVLSVGLLFVIIKSIGLKALFSYFKVKMKQKKGWGIVKVYNETGTPHTIAMKISGNVLYPFGEGGGSYLLKKRCIYYNEFGIATIAYRENDSNPIDPFKGIETNTDPHVMENIMAKESKARESYAENLLSIFKRHWFKIALIYLGPLAILGFIVLNQQDQLAQCVQNTGRDVVINGSRLR